MEPLELLPPPSWRQTAARGPEEAPRGQGHPERPKVLFVGEGVTLAHVTRPLELASRLDPRSFDVVFAGDTRYRRLVADKGLAFQPLPCLPSELFLRRVHRAAPLYSLAELRTFVRDDLRLLARERPDVVVSDFRLSLGISAELCEIPHLALSNAHWSPGSNLPCPVPEHPLVSVLGVTLVRQVLRLALPYFFRLQAKAFNSLRRSYGLQPIAGRGAHEVFTRGTRTLYLDVPQLYDLATLSPREAYIGPVHWEPAVPLPDWWDRLPRGKPIVYVTPGSSGDPHATARLIEALAGRELTLLVATAGRLQSRDLPPSVFAADWLPGLAASQRADAVVCNGGSPMVYQALAGGTPVVGLPVNHDQYYVMEALERKGAGRLLRTRGLRPQAARRAVESVLQEPSYRNAARALQANLSGLNATSAFLRILQESLASRPRSGAALSAKGGCGP